MKRSFFARLVSLLLALILLLGLSPALAARVIEIYAAEYPVTEDGWYSTMEEVAVYLATYEELPDNFLTKNEAENLIREKLGDYLKEVPIVTVRMSNYKIAVLGEVARPGMFTVNNEKVNIFEALAMAGDLTIWGMRDNIKLIRENANGQREIINLNLNNAEIVTCPYYYLQQNDIIYVNPNKTKAKNSDIGQSTSLWFSATSILVSIASLLVTIFR